MKHASIILSIRAICALLFVSCTMSGCMSAEQLVTSGKKKLSTNPDKAAKAFNKALVKNPVNAEAMFGLGDVAFAKGDLNGAIDHKEQGVKIVPRAGAQHYDLMHWYCVQHNSTGALNHMYQLYRDSLYRDYTHQTDTIAAIDLIRQTAAYRRWRHGIRRLKIQPLDAFTNESDKGTENDQFITVVSEGRVVLATRTIQDKNQAYWTKDYVVMDVNIDSAIIATQLDEDYMFCDVLSSGVIDPKVTGEVMIRATNSNLRLSVGDSYDNVSTTGTSLPTTPSLSTTLQSIHAVRVMTNPEELDKTKRLK